LGSPAVPALFEGLQSDNAEVRSLCAAVLGRIRPKAVGAVPELVRLLKDPDYRVRERAAYALVFCPA